MGWSLSMSVRRLAFGVWRLAALSGRLLRFRREVNCIPALEFAAANVGIVLITNQSTEASCGGFTELIDVREGLQGQISKIERINQLGSSFAYRSLGKRQTPNPKRLRRC